MPTKFRYRCRYTDSPLVNNGPVTDFLQLKASNAEEAVRITKVVTGCACVLSVERIDDEMAEDGVTTSHDERQA